MGKEPLSTPCWTKPGRNRLIVYGIYATRCSHEKRVNELTLVWIIPENGEKSNAIFHFTLVARVFLSTCLPIHLNRGKLVVGLGVGEVVLGQHIR